MSSEGPQGEERYRIADLDLDAALRQVRRDRQLIELPSLSFDLLLELARAAPQPVPLDELMDRVWRGVVVNRETVAKRVELLRNELGDDSHQPRYIALVRGRGYRLVSPVERIDVQRTRSRRLVWAVSAAGLALALATFLWRQQQWPPFDPPPERSIAVLPFVAISAHGDDEYFADGLTEEISAELAKIAALKVAGRTSSFVYKDRSEDLRLVGEALGVAHVLEGSVRRSGDRLRVTAQLIKTADGFHVWSEGYDREISDILEIQADITRSVVSALRHALLDVEQSAIAEDRPRDPDLQARYLIARGRLRAGDVTDLLEAARLFDEILERDPDNARVIAGAYQVQRELHYRAAYTPWEAYFARSQAMLARALEIAPDASEVRAAHAQLLTHAVIYDSGVEIPGGLRDAIFENYAVDRAALAAAEEEAARAVALDPSSVEAVETLAFIRTVRQSDSLDNVLALYDRAIELDPLARYVRLGRADALFAYGQFADNQRAYQTLVELFPDFAVAWAALGYFEIHQGWPLASTYAYLERARRISRIFEHTLLVALIWDEIGLPERGIEVVDQMQGSPWAEQVGLWLKAAIKRDYAAAQGLSTAMAEASQDPAWAFFAISDLAQTGDVASGSALAEHFFPELAQAEPLVDWKNLKAVPLLAHFRLQQGRQEESDRLCRAGEAFLAPLPPLVRQEYWAYDLQCQAMRADHAAAIDTITAVIDRGYFWFYVPRPLLVSIRLEEFRVLGPVVQHPDFVAQMERIRAHHMSYRDEIVRMAAEGLPAVAFSAEPGRATPDIAERRDSP